MRGARPDEHRACRVDRVDPGERERQPGQRWAAPAGRWPGAVGADGRLDRPCDLGREAGRVGDQCVGAAVGAPVEDEVRSLRARGECPAPAPLTHRRARDEDPGPQASRRSGPLEGQPPHAREPLVGRRWLELAERPHLGGGSQHSGFATREALERLGGRKGAEPLEEPQYEVHLGLGERRVEPEALDPRAVPAGGLDHVAPRGAGEVRVVEHDPVCPRPPGRGRAARRARAATRRARRG